MKRREFITGKFESSKSRNFQLLSLAEEAAPLSKRNAYHLLRRLSMAPTVELLDIMIGKTPKEAVESLLNLDAPLPDGYQSMNWLDTQEEDPLTNLPLEIRNEIEGRHYSRYRQFKDWWIDLMRDEQSNLMEQLVLFWTGVWCVEFTYDTLSLVPPPLIYRNNQTLRKYRLGNYRKIVEEITLDGAMLLYQSLNYSTKAAPNENYIRELLELFTMGIGHYTEGDIREGARVLTGWRTAAYRFEPAPNGVFNTYFIPSAHDIESKMFMGVPIKSRNEADNSEFQVREQEVKGLINILFSERAEPIAKFISEKIYTYFVYGSPSNIEESIISQMSNTLIENDFEIYPVLVELLSSKHFYSDEFIGAKFKTPPVFIVGLERMLDSEYKTGDLKRSRIAIDDLEQELYDPPNVSGWKGYRSWISTKTYPSRVKYANVILDLTSDEKLINLVKKFEAYGDIDTVASELVLYFLPKEIDSERLSRYKDALLNGQSAANWSANIEAGNSNAANGVRNFLTEIFRAPDFQLC